MGRTPCTEKQHLFKGAWSKEEDELLINYVNRHGVGNWSSLPKAAGLLRCGKSCRLRWMNYLRPNLKKGNFTQEETDLIIHQHSLLGNKWSQIAACLPGRTDNEIKNYWNTQIKRQLYANGIDPVTHKPFNKETTDTTDPPANSQVSEVATTNEINNNNSSSSFTTDGSNQIRYFNVFLNSKVQIRSDGYSAGDKGECSNNCSGVTIEEAHPQINLNLSLSPPPKPQDFCVNPEWLQSQGQQEERALSARNMNVDGGKRGLCLWCSLGLQSNHACSRKDKGNSDDC
ncbi:hypothetical protein LR48_Vigan01g006700 [Vigna angularis]|uniref:Myb-related protein n=2 Tax=Phaseolus angularis TaxID=3914 RepID=A0A0L9TIT1_PHAAN|nr:myb-related protein 308 [Vigna angularis]KAG2410684.1 Myb-related protein [Vigna angularis]KOM30513.1 hypothetical protein LR48_Vigan01g006700 [Vigna angularis]BAT73190.1 hypothetical protein VIGAN_01065400 [Vigna angularis var. angularis]